MEMIKKSFRTVHSVIQTIEIWSFKIKLLLYVIEPNKHLGIME